MLGIIPGKNQTYIIEDYFRPSMEEGKYYMDPNTKIIYLYSKKMHRSTPDYGYFPIYDGKKKIETVSSKIFTEKDLVKMNIPELIQSIDKETAERLVIRGFLGTVITEIPVKAVRDEMIAVLDEKLDKR